MAKFRKKEKDVRWSQCKLPYEIAPLPQHCPVDLPCSGGHRMEQHQGRNCWPQRSPQQMSSKYTRGRLLRTLDLPCILCSSVFFPYTIQRYSCTVSTSSPRRDCKSLSLATCPDFSFDPIYAKSLNPLSEQGVFLMTAVLGIKAAGIHYLNPFVLSSAPPTGSREMIERAFDAGWGGSVIKTLAQDEPNALHNVTP